MEFVEECGYGGCNLSLNHCFQFDENLPYYFSQSTVKVQGLLQLLNVKLLDNFLAKQSKFEMCFQSKVKTTRDRSRSRERDRSKCDRERIKSKDKDRRDKKKIKEMDKDRK